VGRLIATCVLLATGCRDVLAIHEPLSPCFHDDFDAADIDVIRWAPMNDLVELLSVQAGGLVITPPKSMIGESGIATIEPIDFTDGTLEATVLTETAQGQLQTFFMVLTGDSTGFGLITADGNVIGREFTAGVDSPDGDTPPFDPAWTHWRIQHDSAASTITLAVSADGRGYQTIRTLGGRPAPQVGVARLQAGIYSASPDPGVAVFDAFDASGPSCP